VPGSDATGQDALDGAAVERFEDLFSLLRVKRCRLALFTTVLVCLDHESLLVIWTPMNLNISTCSMIK
jgi:hypothetical protein